jgi:hypothetical protein
VAAGTGGGAIAGVGGGGPDYVHTVGESSHSCSLRGHEISSGFPIRCCIHSQLQIHTNVPNRKVVVKGQKGGDLF